MALPAASPSRLVLQSLDMRNARAVLNGRRQDDWADGYPTDGDRDIARSLTERPPKSDTDPLYLPFRIVLVDGGIVVGGIGCHRAPDGQGTVEIGYGIAPEWRDRGLTTEAVRMLVGDLRDAGVRRVMARTRPDNFPSHAVLRHVDFVQTAIGGDGFLIWELALNP